MRRRQLPGEPPPPTKSELKRQAQDVQELADRLIEAPEELVAGLALPEKLGDAIALARRITAHGALLRQRQFVAKLMRGVDPAPIRAALEADALSARLEAAQFKRAERSPTSRSMSSSGNSRRRIAKNCRASLRPPPWNAGAARRPARDANCSGGSGSGSAPPDKRLSPPGDRPAVAGGTDRASLMPLPCVSSIP